MGEAILHFRARHRLRHDKEFQAVHAARARKRRGPLTVATLPNSLEHPRLGLAIGVKVGPATVRNRCKRLIREAFRLEQHRFPRSITGAYDLVVSVRPAPPASRGAVLPPLETVRRVLVELVEEADAEWRRRAHKPGQGAASGNDA